MKHLFIYILCAVMCCGAYAQNVKKSPPPMGLKMTTKKAAEAKKNSKYGKAVSPFLQKTIDKAERQVAAQGKFLRNRVGKAMRVAAKKAPAAADVPEGMARIVFNVEADWGDGSGYQLLFDADAKFYEMTLLADIFAEVDYALPADAALNGPVMLPGESASVNIPGGVYDFYIFNPSPDGSVYIATDGSGDDYNFKAGYEYVISVTFDAIAGHDNTSITCDAPADISATALTAPVSGKDLGQETVTATVKNVGKVAVSSFTATLVVDGGEPVTETVNYELAPGASYDYTFTAKADLSAVGAHTVAVTFDCPDDGLTGDNRVTATVYHVAPIPAPYICEFDEDADALEWTIIDVDEDGLTWEILPEEGYATISYGMNPLNDYMVTINPVALNAGENKIVVDYNGTWEGYYESFEILYGTTSDVSQMQLLKSVENFTAMANDQKAIGSIQVPDGGAEYYFAIRATSEAGQDGIIISRVEVSEGTFIGEPDLSVDKVILPISSGSLGNEPVSAVISNNGTADAVGFETQCLVNGSEYSTAYQPISIAAGETKTVLITSGINMAAEGTYTVGVRITEVIQADGQNPEVNTDNNYAEASVTHYSPTDVPFTVDFSDDTQRGDWASDDSWAYDSDYYFAMTCVGTTPLVSRGINLEAGKAYRLSYNYMAGMNFLGIFQVTEDYEIILGEDGTDPADWDVVEQFSQIYTNDAFVDGEVTFTVPTNGVYSLGFRQAAPQGTFYLASTSVTEVMPYDLTVGGITGMPSQLPKEQLEGMTVSVPVRNNGSETVSGTVTAVAGGQQVGSATFTDLALGTTINVEVPVTLAAEAGDVTVEVEAAIDGHEDGNASDNKAKAGLTITEKVYAYDYMTEDKYSPDYAIGVQTGNAVAAIPFRINKETKLEAVSVGWGQVDGQTIGLIVLEYDPEAQPDGNGYMPVGDEVYYTEVAQGSEVGQIEYALPEAVTLAPGTYMIGVSYTGSALAVDNVLPGQLYLIAAYEDGTLVAIDQAEGGLGTAAIRAILGDGSSSGIGTVETAAEASAVVYNEAAKTLTATSAAGSEVSLAVYSASGAQVGSVSSDNGSCVFDASRLVPGVYVAKMAAADGTETTKFIVK